MKIEAGYLYHIKDEFFDLVNNNGLMINHENGKGRPTYLTILDGELLWFIPISSKVDKYQEIVDKKIKKYGGCRTILIRKIANRQVAILIQNAFPTLSKYIDHVHTYKGKPLKVIDTLKDEVLNNFEYMLSLKKNGLNLFFTNIDKIKEIMLEELVAV